MSRTISYTVKDNCIVPSSPQWGGMQYENNATAVEYSLDADFLANIEEKFGSDIKLCYRIDFDSPVSGYHPSENLEIIDGKITRFIPETVTVGGEPFQTCLVITVIGAAGEEKATILGTPTRIYLSQVIRDEFTEQRSAANVSAAEQKVTELLEDTRYFSAESEKSAEAAAAAAETAVAAEKKTEAAKVALEDGTEFIFLGGNAQSGINIEIAVDDSLSEISENPVQNKVVTAEIKAVLSHTAKEIEATATQINAQTDGIISEVKTSIESLENSAKALEADINTCLSRDYIVEQGTSGGWTYEKWSSGKAVCYREYEFNFPDNVYQAGNSWIYILHLDLPSGVFAELPWGCFANCDAPGTTINYQAYNSKLDELMAYILVGAPYQYATDEGGVISFYFMGRWKQEG